MRTCQRVYFCLFLFLVSFPALTRAASCFPAPTNLVGWWPGEGSAADTIGTNNGTLQGGATASAAGMVGSAFGFDGTNSFVAISNSALLRPTNFTIEAWVRFTSLDSAGSGGSPAGDQYIIFRQNTRSTDFEGFDLSKTRVGGTDVFRFLVSSATAQTAEIHSSTTISTGIWYHVAAVRGPNFTQIYVNGVLERQTNVAFQQDYGNFPLYFGTSGQSIWDHKLKGNLDEVSIYDRPLSSNETASIYAAGALGKCHGTPPTLVTQPVDQSVYVGASINFSVQADGPAPLTYQWRLNGTNIIGATTSTLNLQNVQATQAGFYSVLISNPGGSVLSSNAVLLVIAPPAGVPVITSFAPVSAVPSATVIISGANFSAIASSNIVYFGAVRATVNSATSSSLNVTVPAGATYAPITVTVNGALAVGKVPFKPTFLGNGAGISASTFPNRNDLAGADGPFITAIVDLDGDGKPDLAVANVYAHSISLYRNIGTNGSLTAASFSSRVDLPAISSPSDNPLGFTAADVDGDGKIDLILTDRSFNLVRIYNNVSTPGILSSNSFVSGLTIATGSDPRGIAVRDLDGDGKPDIVTCNYADNTISILHNTSTSILQSFEVFTLPAGAGTYRVAIQDLDGDGRPDLAVVNANSPTLSLFRNISSPGSLNSNSFAARVDIPAVMNNETIFAGDIDGDGLPDLITGGTSQLFSIYRNTSTPGFLTTSSFASEVDFGNPGWVHVVTLSDLDGDSKADVAVVGELGSFFSAFQNQSSPGSISLAPPVGYSTGWNPWGIAVGDLDGDGRPDVVFCNVYDDTITLYHNETPFGGPPSIISQPTDFAAGIGGTAVFSTTVVGQLPLTYAWKRNGTNLPASSRITSTTNANLIISHLQTADAGNYTLVVTNSLGAATSVVAVLNVVTPPPCAAFASDLLGWWPAANSTADVVAGLDGVVAGTGTFGYAPGVVGQAFVFDGIHRDRVDLGNPSNLQIQDFTIEAWVKRSDTTQISLDDNNEDGSTAGEGGLVLSYGRFGYGFGLLNSGQLILSRIDIDGILSSSTVTDTNWHHIAVTKVGNSAIFYIDGLPASTPIPYNTSFSFSSSISIGSRGDALGGTFWGMVDEPAIYKRALSSSEILTLYNSGATGKCPQPPFVVASPTNQTVLAGYPASFNVRSAGSPPLTFAWLFNSSPLSDNNHITGADTPTLYILDAQSADAGSYSVIISNSAGFVTSSIVSLTVQFAAPTFVLQPTNLIAPSSANISFFASVTGSLPIVYQWFFNSNPLTNDIRISGASTPNLTLLNCTTNDTGAYFVVASNSVGSATSSVASLTIGVPPTILQSPVGQTNLVGTNISFSVQADGTPPLSYAWRRFGVNLSDGPRIFGSTNSTLVISNLSAGDAGNYDVVVTNPLGSAVSAIAVLGVVQPPSFTVQPSSRLSLVGPPTTFTASAAGTAPLTYQWQFNGVDIPGQTNTAYTISSVAVSNFGLYRLVATNVYGFAVSADALLGRGTIASWGSASAQIPLIATNVIALSAGNNPAGLSHVLALRADGTVVAWGNNSNGQTNVPASATNIVAVAAGGTFSLALRADGTLLTWGNSNNGLLNIPSTLSNVIAIAAGRLHSLAIRSDGKVIAWGDNASSQLTVPTNLVRAQAISAGSTHSLAIRSDGTVVAWGSNIDGRGPAYAPPSVFDVAAVAAGTIHSVALRSNNTVTAWATSAGVSSTAGLTNAPASISNNVLAISASDGYSLALRTDGRVVGWGTVNSITNVPTYVSNAVAVAAGSFQGLALLNDGRPLITRQPVGGSTWLARNFTFSAAAIGQPPLSYQWQSNSVDISGATNATLTLNNLTVDDAANYRLIVSNALGVASSVAVPLTILSNASLTFLSQPNLFQTNYQGQRLVLTAGVLGNGPLTYQWRFNGAPIPIGTNEDLIFDPVLVTNSGNYSLSVSNPLNFLLSVTSSQRVVLVKAWGFLSNEPPVTLTNAIAIASGYAGEGSTLGSYLALRSDGKVVGWGFSQYGITNIPPSVTNSFITAIAAGWDDALALRSDGTVAAWGNYVYGQTNPPASAVNITAIACGDYHDLALRSDGTVVAWGGQPGSGVTNVPPSATNIVAISGGGLHSIALRANGTVVVWGQTNQLGPTPGNLTNIIAVSAGYAHSLVLKADGTVVQWPTGGQFPTSIPPTNMNNVVAIAAGYSHDLALLADGTVVIWGSYYNGPAAIAQDIANVVQISTRGDRDLAIFGTRAPAVTVQPFDRSFFKGSNTTFNAKAVGAQPVSYQWQMYGTNIPGATTEALTLTNLQFAQAGPYQLSVSNRYGVGFSRIAKLSVTLPLPEALDTTNVPWTSSGNATWFGQTAVSHDGVDAARSGSIGNGQESILQTTLPGPAQLGFWWKVSSEASFDFLEFKLDGITQTSISGEVDWQQLSYAIPSGNHTLVWRYSKDPSRSDGQDAAWVDQVVYSINPPVITLQPVGFTANVGVPVQFNAAATGLGPLSYQWVQNQTNNVGINSPILSIAAATRTNNGSYYVAVSNSGGTTVSSNAILKVLVPQRFSNPIILNNHSILFLSGDSDGGLLTTNDLPAFTAQASSNLVNWVTLPNALSITNGFLMLQDPSQGNYPTRFYRVIEN
jgi:alpha-tubulin suppressor-like RCC1 family protein